jgi:hypothetical protein
MGQWRPSQDHKPTASPCALWWEVVEGGGSWCLCDAASRRGSGSPPETARELARRARKRGTKRANLKKVDVPRLCVVYQLIRMCAI